MAVSFEQALSYLNIWFNDLIRDVHKAVFIASSLDILSSELTLYI